MRAKVFESAAEKQKAYRERKRGNVTIPGENVTGVTEQESIVTQELSVTDKLFDADRPGWYIFGAETKERGCWKCGDTYETRLEMNKFCSPACKNLYLKEAFEMGKKETVSGSHHA
jgi:protein-arginine kinase activator protein McsA